MSPSNTKTVDSVVIGAGPGGYVAAIRLAQLGHSVVCVEREAIGGVCLNWGCIPSKAMIAASSLVESIQHADVMGITAKDVSVDMGKMKDWKDGIVKRLTGGIGELFKRYGVTSLKGDAVFTGPDTVQVKSSDGTTTLKAKQILVATGASTVQLPGMTVDGKRFFSAKEALELTEPPEHFLVIGGGIVGCEIGTYMAKLGSKVTIVELGEGILAGNDPDCIKVVQRNMKKRKIDVLVKSKVKSVTGSGKNAEAVIETPKGEKKIPASAVLVAVGFSPNTKGLGLEKANVKLDERGHVLVDDQCRTSNKNVFAIGDVIGPPYLAHKASKEGMVAAEVMAGKDVTLDVKAMPGAIFTDPEIATVGLDEAAAKAAGHEVKVGSFPFAANGRALAGSHPDGFVKMVGDAQDDTLLGVQIVGYDASNLISEGALAIEMGATVSDVGLTVHPHPTLGETFMEAAHVVEGHAIHIFVPGAAQTAKKANPKSAPNSATAR
ncbi:MAG: dihydrolipoyl dehydrogenase [Planctomycetota bacterium]|nr:MAG: dihydrolipoyl dehydrogenase [Planctomycetota bacterium]